MSNVLMETLLCQMVYTPLSGFFSLLVTIAWDSTTARSAKNNTIGRAECSKSTYQNFARSYTFLDVGHALLLPAADREALRQPADLEQKVGEHVFAVDR